MVRIRSAAAASANMEPSECILLGTHFDSTISTAGASDCAMNVGILMEAARVLSQPAADPLYSKDGGKCVLIVLNGSEEFGLLAAHGFLQHPWAARCVIFSL